MPTSWVFVSMAAHGKNLADAFGTESVSTARGELQVAPSSPLMESQTCGAWSASSEHQATYASFPSIAIVGKLLTARALSGGPIFWNPRSSFGSIGPRFRYGAISRGAENVAPP